MLLSVDSVSKTYLPPPAVLRPLVRSATRVPVTALRSVSFDVSAGEVVGLVGPNGAGKTTLIRIIATLVRPTGGRVTVDGFDSGFVPSEIRRRVGLVLEGDRGIYERLTGAQNLEFFAELKGLGRREARRRSAELLDLVGLAGRDKLVFGYSAGMRSRLNFARALINDPPLLVLDEPTRSLDPIAGAVLVEALRRRAAAGGAVLLSSHRLEEVVTACTRLLVLVDGAVRHDGPAGALSADSGGAVSALVTLVAEGAGGT